MSGVSSPLGISAIILIIIGIIMAIIGIILLIINQNRSKPWYIWFLLIGGVVVAILGGILLALALSSKDESEKCPKYFKYPQCNEDDDYEDEPCQDDLPAPRRINDPYGEYAYCNRRKPKTLEPVYAEPYDN